VETYAAACSEPCCFTHFPSFHASLGRRDERLASRRLLRHRRSPNPSQSISHRPPRIMPHQSLLPLSNHSLAAHKNRHQRSPPNSAKLALKTLLVPSTSPAAESLSHNQHYAYSSIPVQHKPSPHEISQPASAPSRLALIRRRAQLSPP